MWLSLRMQESQALQLQPRAPALSLAPRPGQGLSEAEWGLASEKEKPEGACGHSLAAPLR